MKKRISAVVLAIVLAFGLVACGSGSAASVGGDTASATASPEAGAPEEVEEEIPEIPITKGEATVDVGDFTVTVPEGWLGAGELDVNEEGKYYVQPFYYTIIKGGESAEDRFQKPALTIYYSKSMDAQSLYDSNISPVDENTELDITAGGNKCPAYHAVMNFSDDVKNPIIMEYDNVFIPVSDSSCFRLTMLTYTTSNGETGISAADEDVIAIMESLKAK